MNSCLRALCILCALALPLTVAAAEPEAGKAAAPPVAAPAEKAAASSKIANLFICPKMRQKRPKVKVHARGPGLIQRFFVGIRPAAAICF